MDEILYRLIQNTLNRQKKKKKAIIKHLNLWLPCNNHLLQGSSLVKMIAVTITILPGDCTCAFQNARFQNKT